MRDWYTADQLKNLQDETLQKLRDTALAFIKENPWSYRYRNMLETTDFEIERRKGREMNKNSAIIELVRLHMREDHVGFVNAVRRFCKDWRATSELILVERLEKAIGEREST